LALSVYLGSRQVHAWGQEGHQIVGDLAQAFLTQSAASSVGLFLGSYTLKDIAPWPDNYDHDASGKWSGPMHYVNVPRSAVVFKMSYCTDLCVAKAIVNYTARFTNDATNPFACDFSKGTEPCALEFLDHFTGDIHQPLHISYDDDRGGNDVIVDFFGKQTNLHSVWDTYMIQRWTSDEPTAMSQLQNYITKNPDFVKQVLSSMDATVWANESYQLTRTVCYNYTSSGGVPQLEDAYYQSNLPIIKMRLMAAGLRLSQSINNAVDGRMRPVREYLALAESGKAWAMQQKQGFKLGKQLHNMRMPQYKAFRRAL